MSELSYIKAENEIQKRGSKWVRCREDSSRISNFGNCTKRKSGKPDKADEDEIPGGTMAEAAGTENVRRQDAVRKPIEMPEEQNALSALMGNTAETGGEQHVPMTA